MGRYRFGRGWFVVLLTLLLAAGCSSGGSGGDGTGGGGGGVTITGSVSAPGGALAKPATVTSRGFFQWFAALFSVEEGIAQSSGLAPVPNANVLVFRVDDAGNPVGGPLVTTTTDAVGAFSLELPAGVDLAVDLIAQASEDTTPQPICVGDSCAGGYLDCPVTSTRLDLTPASELATRSLFGDIVARAGTLSDFTVSQVADFVATIQALVGDSEAGATIEETIDALEETYGGLVGVELAGLADQEEAPTDFVGVYNLLEFSGSLDGSGTIQRTTSAGTVTLNADGTYQGDGLVTDVRQSEACGEYACDRTFTRDIQSQDESFSGTYVALGNGAITFTDSEDGGITLGFADPTGNVIVFQSGDDHGFFVALRQGTTLPDGRFNLAGLHTSIPDTFSVNGSWSRFTSALEVGIVDFTGSNFSYTGTVSSMEQQTTCTDDIEGCFLSATVLPQTEPAEEAGTFSIADGGVTFTSANDGDQTLGVASQDGNVIGVQTEDGSDGDVGLLVGIREGAGMSNASLNGAYHFVTFENDFTSFDISEDTSVGVVTFDGAGGFEVAGVSATQDLSESCGASCPAVNFSSNTEGFIVSGTYAVEADGRFTFNGSDQDGQDEFSFEGAVSPDGNVLTLHEVTDDENESGRFFLVGVKK